MKQIHEHRHLDVSRVSILFYLFTGENLLSKKRRQNDQVFVKT